jgi:TldD protein
MSIDPGFARDTLKVLLETGGDFADFFAEERLSCTFRSASPDFTAEETKTAGVGLRVAVGDRWLHAWCDGTNEDEILSLAMKLRDQVGTVGPPTGCRLLFPDGGPEPPALAPQSETCKCVQVLFDAVGKQVPQASTMIAYQEFSQSVFLANSEGRCVAGTRHNVFSPVICQLRGKSGLSVGIGFVGGGAGLPPLEQWAEGGILAASRALSLEGAQSPELGPHPVAFTGTASGIFHEAVGHALEARFAQNGIFAGRIGTQIAPTSFSVADDPTILGRGGSYRFDDEGTPAKRNVLVDQGVLVGFLTDRATARKHGFGLTGNGRRGSYRVQPLSRMSNTYVVAGDEDPAEIVESMSSGILVKSALSGRSGAVGGDFSALVNEAYAVSSGKILHPLGFFTLSGQTLDFLSGVKAVGNDLWIAPNGLCGLTAEQTIPVVSGSPTVLTGPLYVRAVHPPEEVLSLV